MEAELQGGLSFPNQSVGRRKGVHSTVAESSIVGVKRSPLRGSLLWVIGEMAGQYNLAVTLRITPTLIRHPAASWTAQDTWHILSLFVYTAIKQTGHYYHSRLQTRFREVKKLAPKHTASEQ